MLYVTPVGRELAGPPVAVAAGGEADPGRRAAALQEFERVFLYQLLREMRGTVEKAGLMGDSPSQQYFEEMFDDAMAGEMAASGQFGVAQQIAAQWDAADAARRTREALSRNAAMLPINATGVRP